MTLAITAIVIALGAEGASAAPTAQESLSLGRDGDVARYILPPGNFGGVPFTENSTDQLPLYAGLTPLRDNVTDADIDRFFLPEDFKLIRPARREETGRPGVRLVYDAFGIPHVFGETRRDMAFGAGWTTARDRDLLLTLGRGPARAAVADIPNLDAFSLVTGAQSFEPSAEAEALVTKQRELLLKRHGKKGARILREARAYAAGVNAFWRKNGINREPVNVNDVIAVTAFIGSIFGAGGGGEAANSELLAALQRRLGPVRGYRAWDDAMLSNDREAPTTIDERFRYGKRTGGRVRGSVVLDEGSIESVTPGTSAAEAAAAPASRQASNFLLTNQARSASGNSLAVMGPQLGYFYPEIVQQIALHAPGINAQGVAVPGLAMYMLIGRTEDYAWSLTSANHDVRDVFAERLCEPDGSRPTRESTHYRYKGGCRPLEDFNAGELNGDPLTYKVSKHGPVFATATMDGRPYALARKRSTFGRDILNLAALRDLTAGRASSPRRFWKAANQFGFTFNWAYTSRETTAFFSSGLLPRRARGLDRRLPTKGGGRHEWRGFLPQDRHPHDVAGPEGLLLNWNNQSAPGFLHNDGDGFGSAHRVELFDGFPPSVDLTDNVGIMNRAATEDVRSPVWPVISKVLRTGPAPNGLARRVKRVLDEWVKRDAPRLDANDDGTFDDAGPVILDELWRPIAEAVMRPRFGNLVDQLSLNSDDGQSYVDKDLRTLLGKRVRGRFNLAYCGRGSLGQCRRALWRTILEVARELAAEQGNNQPSSWRGPADRTGFTPGLLPDTFPSTNRPTFQQVLELEP